MDTEEEVSTGFEGSPRRSPFRLVQISQIGLFAIVVGYVAYHSKPVLMPLVLAILVSLVLQPVHQVFRSLKFPRMLAAVATVACLFAVLLFGSRMLFKPGSEWAGKIDREVVKERFQKIFRPVNEVQREIENVANEVEEATDSQLDDEQDEEEDSEGAEPADPVADPSTGALTPESGDPWQELKLVAPAIDGTEDEADARMGNSTRADPVVVEIRNEPVEAMVDELRQFGLGFAMFLILILFILAYGHRVVRCLGRNDATAEILHRVGSDISGYLFTITLINIGLGLVIGVAMWLLGMPNPALWGLLATVLNYVPYLGAVIGAGIVFIVAAASFDSAATVVAVPAVYLIFTSIEGNLVTPMVLGGRFRLNPLVLFLWISAWGVFWGVSGMLIAMPALVAFKIICEETATLETFRRVLAS